MPREDVVLFVGSISPSWTTHLELTTITLRVKYGALPVHRATISWEDAAMMSAFYSRRSIISEEVDMPTQLTDQRQAEYQDAWSVTGELMAHPHVLEGLHRMTIEHPKLVYPWIQMLNKLIRALASPEKLDHYDDIIGYATLVRDSLTEKKE